MAQLDLKLDGNVAIVTMNEGENRLNLDICLSLLEMLDRVEHETGALALIVTSGHEKIWVNGFDTDWIDARLAANDTATVKQFLLKDIELRRRLLLYPLTTICAINGHIFGGGAVLSLCFDFRFMRVDRGFFCVPVADRNFPLLPGTGALVKQVLPPHMISSILLTGRRYTSAECLANHVITAAFDTAQFMEKAVEFAHTAKKNRWIVGELKRVLNGDVVKLMEEDARYLESGKVCV